MLLDVDLRNAQMDRITTDNYGIHSGNINIIGMNLLSDSKEDITNILFADKGLKDNVTTGIEEIPHNYRRTAYSPIYKYSVNYDNKEDGGYFVFERDDYLGGNNNPEAFNPSVLVTPVAAQLGGYLTQLNSYDEAFRNMDMYMLMTKKQRQALKFRNKYASLDRGLVYDPLMMLHDDKALWFRPYTTFEKVPLKHGRKYLMWLMVLSLAENLNFMT